MAKNGKALRTISEVEEILGIPQHQLRYWETKINEIRPLRRTGRNRLYHPEDLQLIAGIKELFQGNKRNVQAVRKTLREKGVDYVASLRPVDLDNIPPRPVSDASTAAMARKKNVSDGYNKSTLKSTASSAEGKPAIDNGKNVDNQKSSANKQESIKRIYSRLEELQKRMESTTHSV